MFDRYNQFKQPYLPASTWLPWNDSALKGVNLRWFQNFVSTKYHYQNEFIVKNDTSPIRDSFISTRSKVDKIIPSIR